MNTMYHYERKLYSCRCISFVVYDAQYLYLSSTVASKSVLDFMLRSNMTSLQIDREQLITKGDDKYSAMNDG